jgi:hypothetical protein
MFSADLFPGPLFRFRKITIGTFDLYVRVRIPDFFHDYVHFFVTGILHVDENRREHCFDPLHT